MSSFFNNMNATSKCDDIMSNLVEGCTNQLIQIHSPLCVTHKDQPTSKRRISHVEKVMRKYRKQGMQKVDKLVIDVCLFYHVLFLYLLKWYK